MLEISTFRHRNIPWSGQLLSLRPHTRGRVCIKALAHEMTEGQGRQIDR